MEERRAFSPRDLLPTAGAAVAAVALKPHRAPADVRRAEGVRFGVRTRFKENAIREYALKYIKQEWDEA